ncbi:glutathione S-transferase family protein [Pararhizobium haloflavum]|uniref:glutathione S-transferase family protein n=1 Tax=Pararhizobium haloflavum TaxID=2037914 RepID=UPI000C196E7D|nr:glutathione S-transferase family protein [Pararhizobium haloflavum]
MSDRLIFYFNPRSRAVMARWMLEEVGADYDLRLIDFEKGDNRKPEFLAINPMGKIPAIVTAAGAVITETPAIIAWLADAYPDAGLAPPVGSDARGAYYRWLFFGGSCFEPALSEQMFRGDGEPLKRSAVGWGSYDDVIDTIEAGLAGRDYLLGSAFSAADVYIGAELSWASSFKAPRLGESKVIQDFVARVTSREAFGRAMKPN